MTTSSNPFPERSADPDEPAFQTPWEARAFAIVNQLAATDYYSWSEWTDFLANEIAATEQEILGSKTYYEQWVDACEKLLIAKGLLKPEAIEQRIVELLTEHQLEHHQ